MNIMEYDAQKLNQSVADTIASYVGLKKVTGELEDIFDQYDYIDYDTLEVDFISNEFTGSLIRTVTVDGWTTEQLIKDYLNKTFNVQDNSAKFTRMINRRV